jgi:hypothetical protein
MACSTPAPPAPQVDAAGLVRVTSWQPGNLYAHPSRSIDDYDDILLGDVVISYAPGQQPLSDDDQQRVRMMTYGAVIQQIPAAGQLAATKAGPCTVTLGVKLAALELPPAGSRKSGATTVHLEFRDSVNGDPIVHYEQKSELSTGPRESSGAPDLERLDSALNFVANDVRKSLREALPLGATGARSGQGCKGVIGVVRAKFKNQRAG